MHPPSILDELLNANENCSVEEAIRLESLAFAKLQAAPMHQDWLSQRPKPVDSIDGAVEVSRNGNALDIRLNRPQAHNAINCVMRDALREALNIAVHDTDIDTIRLTGAGKAFCIGGDLSEFGTMLDPEVAHAIRMQTLPAFALAKIGERLRVHIQGACIGAGIEMAAFARHITATPNAWFQLPEIAMGLIPGAGGCVSIPPRIGRERFVGWLQSGKRISAKTALDWGLIDAITDDPAIDKS